jgi:NTE family protein
MTALRDWLQEAKAKVRQFAYGRPAQSSQPPRLGLALGGGFARGIAHIGVLKVLEENQIPISCIAGTSIGALIATAYACGTPVAEMQRHAAATQFKDFGRWTLSWLGLASNERLESYLHRFCAAKNFDELRIPLAIAASDLGSGHSVFFTKGEIGPPLRASCAYPGLFLPIEHEGRILVDGFLTAPVPVDAVRQLGAEFVVSVYLDPGTPAAAPRTVADVVSRSFTIMQRNGNSKWRERSDVIIEPDVKDFVWDDFARTPELMAAGEAAARAALPRIKAALEPPANPASAEQSPALQ